MNLLLDTCAALWWWQDSPKLSILARQWISNSRNTLYFSATSAMEISTKTRLGRLTLAGQLSKNMSAAVAASGWRELPLTIHDAQKAGALEWSHRDPFDRLLAAQALQNKLLLLSCDSAFDSLPDLEKVW